MEEIRDPDECVGSLLDLFPDNDPDDLFKLLQKHSFNLELAVNSLLLSGGKVDVAPAQPQSVTPTQHYVHPIFEQSPLQSQPLHFSNSESVHFSGLPWQPFLPTSRADQHSPLQMPSIPSGVIRLLVLVGLPGSGKSTLSAHFAAAGWTVVNQDQLGNRRACEVAAAGALSSGGRLVVDRMNFDAAQRSHWLRIATENGVTAPSAAALFLDIPVAVCEQRVLSRVGHPTLPATPQSVGIVRSYRGRMEAPAAAEGFGWVLTARTDDEVLAAWQALMA